MPNVFGANSPTIYKSNGETFQLPKAARNGRDEDFTKVEKIWTDLDGNIRTRLKGFRLSAAYSWEYISNDDLYELIAVANDTGQIKIQFETLPPHFPVRIASWKHGLADGLSSADAAEITFEGTTLYKSYPNPDLFYYTMPSLGRGLMIISYEEQI